MTFRWPWTQPAPAPPTLVAAVLVALSPRLSRLEASVAHLADLAQTLLDHAAAAKERDATLLARVGVLTQAVADLKAQLGDSLTPEVEAKFAQLDDMLGEIGVDATPPPEPPPA